MIYVIAFILLEFANGVALECRREPRLFEPPNPDHVAPNACCGPIPYNTARKDCCAADEQYGNEERFRLFDPELGKACCNGYIYEEETQDCCLGKVYRRGEEHDCVCELSDWTEWTSCEENFGMAYGTRVRIYGPREGYDYDCPEIDATFIEEEGDLNITIIEETNNTIVFEDRRLSDDDGASCMQRASNTFLSHIFEPDSYRDLLILADESTSIGEDNFEHVKTTLALMVKNLCGGIGEDRNRVSMLRFSSEIKLDFDFFQGTNEAKVLRNINRLGYRPITNRNVYGTTYTAHAMAHALHNVFKPENGWRNGTGNNGEKVQTEVIIITDGESNDPDGTFTINGQKLKYDEVGIKVYALGVGNIEEDEIRLLTSYDEDSIFYLLSWEDLASFNRIIETIIHNKGYSPQSCVPFSMEPRHLEHIKKMHDPDLVPDLSLQDIVPEKRSQSRSRTDDVSMLRSKGVQGRRKKEDALSGRGLSLDN